MEAESSSSLLMDYVGLKTDLTPQLRSVQFSDVVRHETKGATLRANVRGGASKVSRRWSMTNMWRSAVPLRCDPRNQPDQ